MLSSPDKIEPLFGDEFPELIFLDKGVALDIADMMLLRSIMFLYNYYQTTSFEFTQTQWVCLFNIKKS